MSFDSLLIGIPIFIVLLGPLMFIHELGHFLAAKRAGIRVEEFGMGFPPRAITLFKRGETTYSLNWLPIGAFVRMTGEELPDDPRSFAAQPKRWRFITLFAGPFMNFVGALVILTTAYAGFATQPTDFQLRISAVMKDSPAAKLGLQAGDVILAANSQSMSIHVPVDSNLEETLSASPLKQQAKASIGKPFAVSVLRRSTTAAADAAPEKVELSGSIPADANAEAPLGVSLGYQILKSERMNISLPNAIVFAGRDMLRTMVDMVRVPLEMINNRIPAEMARPVSVIGITNVGVDLYKERTVQGLFPFVRFAGLLSMILGLSNLLPIPALDGGRILFIFIEWIRGRRVDPRREQWVHAIGMVVLLCFTAIIVVLDIVKPVVLR